MKGIYDWVPWFRELSAKIAVGGEQYLIDQAKRVAWSTDRPAILRYQDSGIDPFSFFYYAAFRSMGSVAVMRNIHTTFNIPEPLPDLENDECRVFPAPRNGSNLLFHDGETFAPDVLWSLFRQVQHSTPRRLALDEALFSRVLNTDRVGVAKLTQALCFMNPEAFLPIDRFSDPLVGVLSTPASDVVRHREEKGRFSLPHYESVLAAVRQLFPSCALFEIGRLLYKHGRTDTPLISNKSKYFHISTRLHGDNGDDAWCEFERENAVRTSGQASGVPFGRPLPDGKTPYPLEKPRPGDVMLVRCGVRHGRGVGVVVQNDFAGVEQDAFDRHMRIHVIWINKARTDLERQTERFAMNHVNNSTKGAFPAFVMSAGYAPSFRLLRGLGVKEPPPVAEPNGAVPTPDDEMEHPLNQILYGPPGTGKTWSTVSRAVAIVEGRRVEDVEKEDREAVTARLNDRLFSDHRDGGQVAMVTFHQNYAYEDFIEGIRPSLGPEADGEVRYELRPGVLRKIAGAAAENRRESSPGGDRPDVEQLIGGFLESLENRLEAGEEVSLEVPRSSGAFFVDQVRRSGTGKFQGVDLRGPEGGKPRLALRVLRRDYWDFHDKKIASWEDIAPLKSGATQNSGRRLHFALLKRMKEYHEGEWNAEQHEPTDAKNFVLIIDEINRGNIARIFGELITLVEESRRIGGSDATTVTLPYSRDEFGVPKNLYIIGTMNTADRSIALLDTALRRRFEFVEMMPDSSLIDRVVEGVDLGKLLDTMNSRIRFLLDREHQIGHTYLLEVKDLDGLRDAFQKRIVPLLQEYFYDNWAKIDAVLDGNGFITTEECPDELKGEDLVDDDQKAYEVLSFDDPKWLEADAYRQIYAGKADKGAAAAEHGEPEEGTEADDG